MALPNIAGVVRASFRGTNAAGQQWVNVTHHQYALGASQPGPTEITALDAKLLRLYTGTAYAGGATWLSQCGSEVKLIDATYYVLNGTSVPVTIAHTQQGTQAAGNNQAQEVAMVLTLRTANRGRRYRGRIYLPAPATTTMQGSSGQMLSTAVTPFLAQVNGLLADLPSIQWAWGIASYGVGSSHGVATAWTPFFTPIQSVSMDGIPDVQRRRKQ